MAALLTLDGVDPREERLDCVTRGMTALTGARVSWDALKLDAIGDFSSPATLLRDNPTAILSIFPNDSNAERKDNNYDTTLPGGWWYAGESRL